MNKEWWRNRSFDFVTLWCSDYREQLQGKISQNKKIFPWIIFSWAHLSFRFKNISKSNYYEYQKDQHLSSETSSIEILIKLFSSFNKNKKYQVVSFHIFFPLSILTKFYSFYFISFPAQRHNYF